MESIASIAFEEIKYPYFWGQYGEFRVIINVDNNYINASHLCKLAEKETGRTTKYNDWARLKGSINLIDEICSDTGIPASEIMVTIQGEYSYQGTYVHPDLIPHVACWTSPKFAIKVSKIINASIVREYQEKIRKKDDKIDLLIAESKEQSKMISNQSKKLDEQMAKMDEQSKMITEQSIKNDEQSRRIDELLGYAIETKEEVCKANEINERVQDQLEIVQEKLGIAVEDRVPKDHDDGRNEVLVFFSNKDNEKLIKVTRRQKRNMSGAVRSLKSQGYHMQLYISEDPNTVNIWNRVRDSLPIRIGMRKSPFVVELAKNAEPKDLFDYMLFVAEEKRVV